MYIFLFAHFIIKECKIKSDVIEVRTLCELDPIALRDETRMKIILVFLLNFSLNIGENVYRYLLFLFIECVRINHRSFYACGYSKSQLCVA